MPSFNADNDTVTMAGFSSGAGKTVNMHVIYSDRIKGVGLICGGWFQQGAVSVAYYENLGLIPSSWNLFKSPVYIQSGLND